MQWVHSLGSGLAAFVDFIHALAMVFWVVSLPFLCIRRWPRWRRFCAYYALAFIVLSQASDLLLGECFLTTLSRLLAEWSGAYVPDTWFTVRLAQTIFNLRPSESLIADLTKAIVLIYCLLLFRNRDAFRFRVPLKLSNRS